MSSGVGEPVTTSSLDEAEALSAANTAAWRWQLGAPVIEWSPDAARVLGVPEMVLRSPELLRAAVHPDDDFLISRCAEMGCGSGGPIGGSLRLQVAGRVRWFDVSGTVVRSDPASRVYATGTARDVTDAREAEDALISALREAESSLAQLGAGVGEWDSATNVVRIFSGVAGVGRVAATPHQVSLDAVLRDMDDLGQARLRAALWRAADDGESFTVEVKMRADDGDIRHVMIKGGPAPAAPERVRLVALVVG